MISQSFSVIIRQTIKLLNVWSNINLSKTKKAESFVMCSVRGWNSRQWSALTCTVLTILDIHILSITRSNDQSQFFQWFEQIYAINQLRTIHTLHIWTSMNQIHNRLNQWSMQFVLVHCYKLQSSSDSWRFNELYHWLPRGIVNVLCVMTKNGADFTYN